MAKKQAKGVSHSKKFFVLILIILVVLALVCGALLFYFVEKYYEEEALRMSPNEPYIDNSNSGNNAGFEENLSNNNFSVLPYVPGDLRPIPISLAGRVIGSLDSESRGIALFVVLVLLGISVYYRFFRRNKKDK